MPEHTFTKVYQLSDVNWNPAVNVANGAALTRVDLDRALIAARRINRIAEFFP